MIPKLRAYLELLRLPNVFTAAADVLMGCFFFEFLRTEPGRWRNLDWRVVAMLVGASACFYLAGMVLNDFFDRDVDARQRPQRPIPSGRISSGEARSIGTVLMVLGLVLSWTAGYFIGGMRAGLVGTALAAAVLLYDAWLKRTPAGPVAMGACRMFNVFLGMSLHPDPWQQIHLAVAGGIGVYVIGVTWFARTEAIASSRLALGLSTLVMIAGLGLLASYPELASPGGIFLMWLRNWVLSWYFFWTVIVLLITWRCVGATIDPTPRKVQMAVRQCLFSIIVLDAAVCFAMQGRVPALFVLALLIPALVLGRWLYST